MKNRLSLNSIMKIVNICFLMILENFAGDSGMGYFFAAYILFAWLYLILMGSMMNTITKMVSVRMYKGMYGSAKKILKNSIFYAVIIGMLVCLILFVLSDFICLQVLKVPYFSAVIKIFAVMFFCNALIDTLNGYYLGIGNAMPCNIANLLRILIPCAGGIVLVRAMTDYGKKAANLLENQLAAPAYAAMGIGMIYLLASFLILLLFIILFLAVEKRSPIGNNENARNDIPKNTTHNFFSLSFAILKSNLFPITTYALLVILYIVISIQYGVEPKVVLTNLGAFTTKFGLFLMVPFYLFREYALREKMKIYSDIGKDEKKNASMRIQYFIKNTIFMLMPPSIIIIMLADPLVKVLFTGEIKLAVLMLRSGGILLLLLGLSYTLHSVLCALRKENIAFFIRLFCFVLQIVTAVFFLAADKGNIMALIYSFYVQGVSALLLQGYILLKTGMLHYEDILNKLIKTTIACCIVAAVEAMLDRFVMMNVPLFWLCVLLGYLIFYISIFALRGVSKKDEQSLKRTLTYYPVHFIMDKLHL